MKNNSESSRAVCFVLCLEVLDGSPEDQQRAILNKKGLKNLVQTPLN
jgi:hypothetical protein